MPIVQEQPILHWEKSVYMCCSYFTPNSCVTAYNYSSVQHLCLFCFSAILISMNFAGAPFFCFVLLYWLKVPHLTHGKWGKIIDFQLLNRVTLWQACLLDYETGFWCFLSVLLAPEEEAHRQWHRSHRVPGGKHPVCSRYDTVQLPACICCGAGRECVHGQCHIQGWFSRIWSTTTINTNTHEGPLKCTY